MAHIIVIVVQLVLLMLVLVCIQQMSVLLLQLTIERQVHTRKLLVEAVQHSGPIKSRQKSKKKGPKKILG